MKQMKRMIGVLAVLLALSTAARADRILAPTATMNPAAETAGYAEPMIGTAATRDTTPLLDAPSADGGVLMTYFPCVRVEVLDVSGGAYVQVRVGDEPGSLTGYMRADALAYTEDGVRSQFGWLIRYGAEQAVRLYAAQDAQAGVLDGSMELGGAHTLGYNDGWVHVRQGDVGGGTGFVKRGETAFYLIQRDPVDYCHAEPKADELSYEEAAEAAKRILLEDGATENGGGQPVTREMLDACSAAIRCIYTPGIERPLRYQIDFRVPENMRRNRPEIYAFIVLEVEGKDVAGYNYGNG